MKRKKLVAIVLGTAMVASSVAALCACGDGKSDVGNFTEDGAVYNAVTAKTYKATRADNRVAAYTAYKKDGTSIGDYTTLSAAINAAVRSDEFPDSPTGETGAYVTKKGETFKMFQNKNGFTASNNDQFWFYEDGTKLDSYDCWANDQMAVLKNTNYIVNNITDFGATSIQSWNSYGLLDEEGNRIGADGTAAQSWELSSTMDAAVLQFSSRLKGVTGLNYTIDLSETKITPAYDGTDVFAFMGFYAWQDYYVISIGIACDVTTGNWYPYEATSRDNSFSDATYNIGEDCVMTSTWNEAGGYFTPDNTEVNLSIKTMKFEDDEGEYQEDHVEVAVKDGATFRRSITNSLVNEKFAGRPLGYENAFIFVAGLDIKNEVVKGVQVSGTDYFNGAKFENLAVKAATAHVPGDDETVNEIDYAHEINPDWKGKDHNVLMAAGKSAHTAGVMDYTILNTNACVDFQMKDGKDVYSFSYDKSPVSTDNKSATLKGYQDAIDALSTVTKGDSALAREKEILDIEKWYGTSETGAGSTLSQKYRMLLDFTHYLAAREALSESYMLDAAGEAQVEKFNALSNIAEYQYLGLHADEGATDIKGYLLDEITAFDAIKAAYDNFSNANKVAFGYRVNMEQFEEWIELSAFVKTDSFKSLSFTAVGNAFRENIVTTSQKPFDYEMKKVNYTGETALNDLLRCLFRIADETSYKDEKIFRADDASANKATVMTSDNDWYTSFHACYLMEKFNEAEIELPKFVTDMLEKVAYYDSKFLSDFQYLYNVLNLSSKIQSGEITEVTDEVKEIVNTYMVGFESFKEGGLLWNFNASEGKDFLYRGKDYLLYFDLPTYDKTDADGNVVTRDDGVTPIQVKYNLIDHIKAVTDLLGDGVELTASGLGIKAEI